jgi:hypothetical protein
MGAFDQFKDKADKVADNAKEQLGNRRGQSPRGAESPERMERMERAERGNMPREGRERVSERVSERDDEATERMDRQSEREQDDWA